MGLEPPPCRGTFSMFLDKINHSYDKRFIIGVQKENKMLTLEFKAYAKPDQF
jgi:hypothetical protein